MPRRQRASTARDGLPADVANLVFAYLCAKDIYAARLVFDVNIPLYCRMARVEETINIHYAIQRNYSDLVHYMIKECGIRPDANSCKLDKINGVGKNCLEYAAEYGCYEIMRDLVELCGIAPDSNTLDAAVEFGHLNIVRYLIEKCGIAPTFSTFECAAEYGHHHITHYLKQTSCIVPSGLNTVYRIFLTPAASC